MLYLLSGKSDLRKEYVQLVGSQESLVPQHIYDNDIQENEFFDIIATQTGLFGDKKLYVIHGLSRGLDLKTILPILAESDNIFIFSEETVTKPIIKAFEQSEATIKDFGKEAKKSKESFNMFSLTDALGVRDKKKLWLLFQEAREEGSAEEIHGILFWQIKNLALVKKSSSNPGMNPFVYSKTSGYAQKFTEEEITTMARKLVHMFHTRDTYSTLDIELEKFILAL